MRKEKALISMLRDLVDLLAEESAQNSEFAAKIEHLLSDLPEKKSAPKRPVVTDPLPEQLPDIYAEWKTRGETEFRHWLGEQPIPVLRAIIRVQDFDPTRRTVRWKEAEKLATFIADSLQSRLSRGSAFMGNEAVD